MESENPSLPWIRGTRPRFLFDYTFALVEFSLSLFQRRIQSGSFLIVEVVVAAGEHLIDGHQLDHFALG